MKQYMDYQAETGEKILQLTALGLGLNDSSTLNKLTEDGWHHMRVLRFPPTNHTNGKGKTGRGIGSHTDYGLLVIAAQDEVGGLFVRKPIHGEAYENWNKSSAGLYENDDKWTYVPPMDNVFTVFPGDMMQFVTNSFLPSTPHKVGLNTRERFAFAYFHEPNFNACIKQLKEFKSHGGADKESIHYGTHFTNMFMRNYPQRITAQRMREDNRMALLDVLKKKAEDASL
jgi:isopenicillin N synthase-like dioxygenase